MSIFNIDSPTTFGTIRGFCDWCQGRVTVSENSHCFLAVVGTKAHNPALGSSGSPGPDVAYLSAVAGHRGNENRVPRVDGGHIKAEKEPSPCPLQPPPMVFAVTSRV